MRERTFGIDRDLDRLALLRTVNNRRDPAGRAQPPRLVLAPGFPLLCLKCCVHNSVLTYVYVLELVPALPTASWTLTAVTCYTNNDETDVSS